MEKINPDLKIKNGILGNGQFGYLEISSAAGSTKLNEFRGTILS